VIETADETLTETRDNPEESFEGQQREAPWNDIHVVYFAGEALWTYLNTPFLYTYEGFTTEETPSIQVEGETWRRLKVTFPDTVKSHTRENGFLASGPMAYCAGKTTRWIFLAVPPGSTTRRTTVT